MVEIDWEYSLVDGNHRLSGTINAVTPADGKFTPEVEARLKKAIYRFIDRRLKE